MNIEEKFSLLSYFHIHFFKIMWVSAFLYTFLAYCYPFYSAKLAKLGALFLFFGTFLLVQLRKKFPTQESVESLTVYQQKAISSVVFLICIAAGTGMAFPFIKCVNWYFAPQ